MPFRFVIALGAVCGTLLLGLTGCQRPLPPASPISSASSAPKLPPDVRSRIGTAPVAAVETTVVGPFEVGLALLEPSEVTTFPDTWSTVTWATNTSDSAWELDMDRTSLFASQTFPGGGVGGSLPSRPLGLIKRLAPGETLVTPSTNGYSHPTRIELRGAFRTRARPRVDRAGAWRELSTQTDPAEVVIR